LNILMVNAKCGFTGGVERYVAATAGMLSDAGHRVYGLFEEKVDGAEDFVKPFHEVFMTGDVDREWQRLAVDLAIINKTDSPRLVRDIRQRFTTYVFFHDHDYYCPRRHKYFPLTRKNCEQPFSLIRCGICTCMIERRHGTFAPVNLLRKQRLIGEIRQCRGFLIMSEHMRNNLLINGYDKDKIHKLYPVQRIDAMPEVKKRRGIVFIGQLIRGKGVDLLLKAVAGIPGDFVVWIVGRGNQEEELRRQVRELHLENKIFFTGWTAEPEKYLRQATVAAVPSRWQEPFGLVGIEAFSCGTPAVGFAVGGIGEWLEDRRNGRLIPAGDVMGLRTALEEMLNRPELAAEYGRNGYEKVRKEFSPEVFFQRFEEIFGGGKGNVSHTGQCDGV